MWMEDWLMRANCVWKEREGKGRGDEHVEGVGAENKGRGEDEEGAWEMHV